MGGWALQLSQNDKLMFTIMCLTPTYPHILHKTLKTYIALENISGMHGKFQLLHC